jgi:hypothetical protein
MQLNEMAMDRKEWRAAIIKSLTGALGGYAKLRYYKAYGLPDSWSHEIKRLLVVVEKTYDKSTTTNFDKYRAFYQAYKDSDDQTQILSAKNQIVSEYLKTPMQREKFLAFFRKKGFDAKELLDDMIKEFSPKIQDILFHGKLSESGIWQWQRDFELNLNIEGNKVKLFAKHSRGDSGEAIIEVNGERSTLDEAQCIESWVRDNEEVIGAYWSNQVEEADVLDILEGMAELDCILVGPKEYLVEMANASQEFTGINGTFYFSTKEESTNKQAHALGRVKLMRDDENVSCSIKAKKNGKRIISGKNERLEKELEKFVIANEDLLWEYWITPARLANPSELKKKFVKNH